MQFRGRVQGGVVVLEQGAALPEGSDVTVTVAPQPEAAAPPAATTLGKRLMKYDGVLKGLPSDLARNHDHYIHGN